MSDNHYLWLNAKPVMILKLKYLFALAAAAMMIACDPENNVEPGGGGGTEDHTRPVYTVKLADLHNPTIQRKWEKGDKIAVFNTAGMEEYVFEGEDGSLSGIIKATGNGGPSGDPLEKVLAVYPSASALSLDAEGRIRVSFDETSLIGHETQTSIWVASADPSSGVLEFKCITAYLEIPIYGRGEISTVRLMSPDKIKGPAKVNLSEGKPLVEMIHKTVEEGDRTPEPFTLKAATGQYLPVEGEAENARKILVPLPATQYKSGLTFEVDGLAGRASGVVKSLSSLNADGLTSIDPIEVEFIKLPPDTSPVPFTDEGIKGFCMAYYDLDRDGVFTFAEAKTVPWFGFDHDDDMGTPFRHLVKSVDDLQYFPESRSLGLKDTPIPSLCLRNNPRMEDVSVKGTPNLKVIDLKGAPNIFILHLEDCGLASLDVSFLPLLSSLNCRHNELKELDLSATPALLYIDCRDNHISSLDVSDKSLLEDLYCNNNQITRLDLRDKPYLKQVWCSNNELTSLDLGVSPKLYDLVCGNNHLTSLDVTGLPELQELYCYNNKLKELDLSKNPKLERLDCQNIQISSLDLSALPELKELNCASNALTSLDLSKTQKLKEVWCGNNLLSSLDISTLSELEYIDCGESQLERLNLGQNDNLKELNCTYNKLTSLDLSVTSKLERLF